MVGTTSLRSLDGMWGFCFPTRSLHAPLPSQGEEELNIGRTAVRPYICSLTLAARLVGEGELNIGRTAVRPYGSPSPLSGTRGEGRGWARGATFLGLCDFAIALLLPKVWLKNHSLFVYY
jgi:hypothetical protein